MSTQREAPGSLRPDEIAVLARLAGITIAEESLPLVTEMLDSVSSAAQSLLVLPDTDVTGVVESFDPSWPTSRRGAS